MLAQLRQWKDWLLDAIEEVERESLLEQASRPEGYVEVHVVGITVLACIVLSVLEFYGTSGDWQILATGAGWIDETLRKQVEAFFRHDTYGGLYRLGYWSVMTCIGYLIVPSLYVLFFMDDSLVDMGLDLRGTIEHAPLYIALYLLILPAVYLVSSTASFRHTYPFYQHAGRSLFDFLLWELLYALQFFSLEFFFRGFLIHGLKARFGFYSIFVSVIPYCMIHFGKPFPEAIGAILAGLTLGAFSLFTGNIWLGVLIHVSVAISMDVFAALHVFEHVNDTVSRWFLQVL
jgi:membrane protease YdiL (CAAX protease family)